jgi:hypothetical protein
MFYNQYDMKMVKLTINNFESKVQCTLIIPSPDLLPSNLKVKITKNLVVMTHAWPTCTQHDQCVDQLW